MTKLRSPILSLGAHGSIGDALTYQKRKGTHFSRQKPFPTDPQSLAQIYHRWDYEDYCYLWHQQSYAQQLAWRKLGSRYGITAFNAFMRDRLKTLWGIAARYHHDEPSGIVAYDSSSNLNHGTVFGAIPAHGRVSRAKYFDGIDDYITAPDIDANRLTADLTVELFFYPIEDHGYILGKGTGNTFFQMWQLSIYEGATLRFSGGNAAGDGTGFTISGLVVLPLNAWSTIHCRITGALAELFIDGLFDRSAAVTERISNTGALRMGQRIDLWGELESRHDHFTLYNYSLPNDLIKRHADRRYPL